jgi:CYTH domain-containing protein
MKKKPQNPKKLYLAAFLTLAFLTGVASTALIYKITTPAPRPTEITGGKEIERKWLLDPDNIPINLSEKAAGIWEITQNYINFSPEIRIRKVVNKKSCKGTETRNEEFPSPDSSGIIAPTPRLDCETTFFLTVKSDLSVDGLTRKEVEWYISEAEYQTLLAKSEGNTIYKTRFSIDKGGLHYEYDIFHGNLSGLAYLEIEFTDEESAWNFTTPSYAIKDVTSDKRFKNQSLAKYGKPIN